MGGFHPKNVHGIIGKFSTKLCEFTETISLPTIGRRSRADEIVEDIRGVQYCFFAITDHKTRLLLSGTMSDKKDGFNAIKLPEASKIRAGAHPTEFVTDGLPSYAEAFWEVYAPKNPLDPPCVHLANAGINNDKADNNGQERFNSTLRPCLKPRRGIKRTDAPISTLFAAWHNFVRHHMTIGCTPAEAAGVVIHSRDRRIHSSTVHARPHAGCGVRWRCIPPRITSHECVFLPPVLAVMHGKSSTASPRKVLDPPVMPHAAKGPSSLERGSRQGSHPTHR